MGTEDRILVVDDQPMNVDILCKILRKNYTVETALSGEECLDKVRQFEPDLVLLDVMMPGIDGYEACRRIKSSPVGDFTQVILVSGKASQSERQEGYEAGADDYLPKPFDHNELRSKVRVQFRLREALVKVWQANRQVQIQNTQLEELVAERTAEIVATRDITVFALAQLADSRDSDTGEHLVRMRSYSQILAEELEQRGPYVDEIDQQFLNDLYRASPLHDIGKVGIPDAILQKPGKLTPQEFEIMKQHVIIGAEAIETVMSGASGRFLDMAARVARYHHERFDGGGYCSGLSGHDIPLAARIVAVADVYDALTSKRVYKPAFEADTAHDIIVEESGSHFDPAIVDAFRARYDDFLNVRKQAAVDSDNCPAPVATILQPGSAPIQTATALTPNIG